MPRRCVRRSATAEFDVVAEFLAFTPEHVAADLALFEGRCGQYVFISSASAYQKPPQRLPITESTPLRNPFWQYSRDKIACEDLLVEAYRERGLPDHDRAAVAHLRRADDPDAWASWTDIARMRRGKPVVIHGDGTSLWTITHSDDFAVAFTGPARQSGCDRRGVHHHRIPRSDLEPDLRLARGCRGRRRARTSCTSPPRRSPRSPRSRSDARSATRRTRWSSTTAR